MASNRRDGRLSGLEEQQDLDIGKREKHSKQREQIEERNRAMCPVWQVSRICLGQKVHKGEHRV